MNSLVNSVDQQFMQTSANCLLFPKLVKRSKDICGEGKGFTFFEKDSGDKISSKASILAEHPRILIKAP